MRRVQGERGRKERNVDHSQALRGCVAELYGPFVRRKTGDVVVSVCNAIRSDPLMLWQASIARTFPGRACARIALRTASVASRSTRLYSQHRSSDSDTPQESRSHNAEGSAQQPASPASSQGPEASQHPPKEEMTPLAKHIRDSIKVLL